MLDLVISPFDSQRNSCPHRQWCCFMFVIFSPFLKWSFFSVVFFDGQGWPATGAVKLEGIQMRYRPGLDMVLKGVTLDVKVRSSRFGVWGLGFGVGVFWPCCLSLSYLDHYYTTFFNYSNLVAMYTVPCLSLPGESSICNHWLPLLLIGCLWITWLRWVSCSLFRILQSI